MFEKNYLLVNILKSLLFGMVYAILEVNVPFYKYIPCLNYRIFYFVIFAVAMISVNYRVWFANFMLSMAFEDVSYWLIKDQLPFSYAWYYPVVGHIPIVDIVEGVLAVIFYAETVNKAMVSKVVVSRCNMFYYFTHGKAHDLYGLLILVVVGVVVDLVSVSLLDKTLGLVDVIIGTGIFVDLWSHCFHH